MLAELKALQDGRAKDAGEILCMCPSHYFVRSKCVGLAGEVWGYWDLPRG